MSSNSYENSVSNLAKTISQLENTFTYREYLDLNNKFHDLRSFLKERDLFIEFSIDHIKQLRNRIAELETKVKKN